tara:strand:+ start:167 stop:598 length:432 start_codon:yes stop_codon:yes gene_type:complete
MALTKTQADGINLADTFAFTGTVTGAGDVTTSTAITKGSASINVLSGLNKVWWHLDSNNGVIDDSYNVSSFVDSTGYSQVNLTNTMDTLKWTCVLTSDEVEAVMSIFGGFETTTACYYRSYYPRISSNAEPDDVSGILTGDLA